MARWPGGDQTRYHFYPAWQASPLTRRAFLRSAGEAPYHWHFLTIDTDNPLKPRTNLVIAVIAAAVLAAVAVKSFTRQPPQIPSKPVAANCTPEAIKQVADALERSILSANCAKLDASNKPKSAPIAN